METHVNHSLLNRAGNAAADDAADQEERGGEGSSERQAQAFRADTQNSFWA